MGKPAAQRRQFATEQAIEAFKDKPFSVRGGHNCLTLALKTAKGMGVKIPNATKFKGYTSIREAQDLMEKLWGVRNVSDWADKFFIRKPPAAALPGDILALPAFDDEGGIGGLGIAMGNGLVFCYDEGHALPVAGRLSFDPGKEPLGAWGTIK